MSNTLAQVLEQQSSNHQYMMIGDTDHRNLALRDKLAEEENFAALARSGVKHLFLELPMEFDPLAQQLSQGKISRAVFLDEMKEKYRPNFQGKPDDRQHLNENTATLIETARKYGITTHFSDPGNGSFELGIGIRQQGDYLIKAMMTDKQTSDPQVYNEVKGILTNTFNTTAKGEQRIVAVMSEWIQQMPPDKLVQVRAGMPEISDEALARRLDDRELAAHIKAVAKDEKAAIFYGHEHGNYVGGLTDLLGAEKCSRVLLLGAQRRLEDVMEPKVDQQLEHRALAGFYAIEEDVFKPVSLGQFGEISSPRPSLAEKKPSQRPPQM